MVRFTTRELSRMGRRRFLRTLTELGVSASALGAVSKETLADVTHDPRKEIPRLELLRHTNHEEVVSGEAPPRREAKFYTIPRDEWAVIEATQDAMRQVNHTIESLTTSGLVSASVGTTVEGHHRKRAVFVTWSTRNGTTPEIDFDELENELPATVTGIAGHGEHAVTVEGIPVKVERGTIGDETCDVYDSEYRDPGIPAGCMVETGCATIATPAYDNDEGEYQLTTAGHAFDEFGIVYQPTESDDDVGSVDEVSTRKYFDAAKVDMYNGEFSEEYDFAADNGDDTYRNLPIIGTLGWDTIKDGVDDLYLNKQGATTGVVGGYVRRIYEASGDPNAKMFEIEAAHDGGDSGGPHYRHYHDSLGDSAAIAGIHKGWVSSTDYAAATAMVGVEDEFNLQV